MSSQRLRRRAPSATFVTVAKLDGHTLRFHKRSNKDGSGKCDALHTAISNDVVHGVIHRIDPGEKGDLDKAEGVGYGYERKNVTVVSNDGCEHDALTYYATDIDGTLKPLCWYWEHVVIGAEEHGLPAPYIEMLRSIEFIRDHDQQRRVAELSIYLPA